MRQTVREVVPASADGLWYKDAVFYELRVGTFQDSDADGMGDFRGLASRLDYLQDLGVNTLWLLPFYPSPLRDDGYDISDYTAIHPDYGTLEDFQYFLDEAHSHGLRVVTELVLNHTSDQHPWFQRARRAPSGSRWRDFYVWSEKPDRYSDARVIFKDFETSNWTWDPTAKAYYWHRFYSHQPDLNFDHSAVRKAVFRAVDFWLRRGVDGLRLDAIPYLFEREGTNCENLAETHAFLRDLRAHIDARFPARVLLAEANQWPEDAASYFGQGDECHMAFHFPVMPRIFMALQMEDRFPIIDILNQTPAIGDTCQWALFLRNHDELTLEMVTDEERDYMYRIYAHDARARINLGIRRRLAPLLSNHRRRIELMNALLFSLPGTPVIYYGDEIGMGDNFYLGDRNGVRTPMQWSGDRNAGFSRANPQRLNLPVIIDAEYHYEAINVEAQQNNPHSLLFWMKRLIALRKRYLAFGRGTIDFLKPSNRKALAFLRVWQEQRLLIVANLSRFVEYVELDLSAFRGTTPVELFGRHRFPPIGELPYLLTLGPHSFYWFELEAPPEPAKVVPSSLSTAAPLRVAGGLEELFAGEAQSKLEARLPAILQSRRWYGGKGQPIESARVVDTVGLTGAESSGILVLVRVQAAYAGPAIYVLPVGFASGEECDRLRKEKPEAVFAELEVTDRNGDVHGVLYDALEDPRFCDLLLQAITRRRRLRGERGEIVASSTPALRMLRGDTSETLSPSLVGADQSNTSVLYGRRFILKLYRRCTEGENPELEIGRFLTQRRAFQNCAPLAGALEYQSARQQPMTIAILHGFVPNEGDTWRYTLDEVARYFERVLALGGGARDLPEVPQDLLELVDRELPPLVGELVGGYLETARLLGKRTAELHTALACDKETQAFAPEPFNAMHQRSLYQSVRNLVLRTLQQLREQMNVLPASALETARSVVSSESQLLEACRTILQPRIGGMRIRCHGDLHLGQILHTGTDCVFIDFEGEPARSLSERRFKRSPLRDAAGMLRSFDYAAHQALIRAAPEGVFRPEDVPTLEPWARFWRQWVNSAYLRAYLEAIGPSGLVPGEKSQLAILLPFLLLEKCIYEIAYELNHRPDWVQIPLRGVLELASLAH
jgi:maltose alpha-D-glucosyltransferase/alpha-amylase